MIPGRHPSELWPGSLASNHSLDIRFLLHCLEHHRILCQSQLCYDAMICLLSGALMIHLTFSFS